ncbi:YciI family protein [Micromonospora avicenniae]|uniref:YciI family protein n=1 Tax=Micromonospora avicenniae TaxID=1198245 RepID=UPI003CCB7A0E
MSIRTGPVRRRNVRQPERRQESKHVTDSGERAVTDGPFAESREVLGGYYVIDVPDLDVAVDWAGCSPPWCTGRSTAYRAGPAPGCSPPPAAGPSTGSAATRRTPPAWHSSRPRRSGPTRPPR